MQKIVTNRCNCGYLFEVEEQIEVQLLPGNYQHETKKKDLVVGRKLVQECKFRRIYVFAFPLDREIKILACPQCGAPLLVV